MIKFGSSVVDNLKEEERGGGIDKFYYFSINKKFRVWIRVGIVEMKLRGMNVKDMLEIKLIKFSVCLVVRWEKGKRNRI